MARIGTSYSDAYQRPDDKAREDEEAARKEMLQDLIETPGTEDERDILAPVLEALDDKFTSLGAEAFNPEPMDAALHAIKDRSAANVANLKMSPTERQATANATALADELEKRGIVASSATGPVEAATVAAPPEPQEDDGEYGWYDSAEDRWYKTDAQGNFHKDEAGNWATYPPGAVFEDIEAEDNYEEEYDDAA